MSTENVERNDGTPERDAGGPLPQEVRRPVGAVCPLCGGLARHKWKDVFTLDLATFLIFGALTPFTLQSCMALDDTVGLALSGCVE